MTQSLLDTTRLIEIPEGVELTLRIAGPVVRAMAWSIDALFRLLIEVTFFVTLFRFGELGRGVFFIALFLIEWFYPVFFELYHHGATPGKKIFKIKVIQDSGLPIDGSSSIIRNLLRIIDFLPLLYGFGLLSMLICKDFKRIGDLTAGTVVIYQDEVHTVSTIPDQSERLPFALNLSLEEQHTIIHFAQRIQTLNQERVRELADLLTPLTGKRGEEGVQALCQTAKGFLGEHLSKGSQ